jgi:hypothetical protein
MTEHNVHVATRRTTTGPVSRVYRLLLAGLMAWLAFDWATAGISDFSETETLTNPWLWVIIGTGIYYGLYGTPASGFGRRWGLRTVLAFGFVVVGAGVAAVAADGELWAAPLTWLLFGFVVGFLILTTVAELLSMVLGTPGCEFGALAESIRRLRGVPQLKDADAMWCVLGVHRLDAWEAHRSMERNGAESRARTDSRR